MSPEEIAKRVMEITASIPIRPAPDRQRLCRTIVIPVEATEPQAFATEFTQKLDDLAAHCRALGVGPPSEVMVSHQIPLRAMPMIEAAIEVMRA
jgi:hypothetical protein